MMKLKNISDYILTGDTINLWIPLLSWIPRRYVLLILPQCLHSISLVQVFLSATLPDNLMPTFLTCVGLASTLVEPPTIIRQLCFRPELAHHVVHVPLDTPLSRQPEAITVDLVNALDCVFTKPSERMIIFAQDTLAADSLANRLNCARFHNSLLGSEERKNQEFEEWRSGKVRIIVATTALVQGLDYADVHFVLFYLGAFGMIGY